MPPAGTTTAPPRRKARSSAPPRRQAGSSRKTPPRAKAPPSPRTKARPRPRTAAARGPLRIRWERVGRILLVIVLAVVAGVYVQQGLAYLSARSQTNQQKALAGRLIRENRALAREQSSLNNPATIMHAARALGMVEPNERPYVVTGLPAN